MKRLIINADDLGLSAGVNRGIVEAHRRGVVTSATAMATGARFSEAVVLAKQQPGLGVGCHVVLTDGRPALLPERLPSLVTDGSFRRSFSRFAVAAMRGRLAPEEIFAEADAQIGRLQDSGLRVSHLDTHKHSHMFPAVLRPLLRAARERGVRAIRNPFAPLGTLAVAHLLRRPYLWKRYSQVRFLRRWREQFRKEVAEAGMVTTDGTFGIVVTGALDDRLFQGIVGCIPEGTWEFVCHPGYCDDELMGLGGRLRESREKELEVLTSEAAREALQRHGVELISYWDLI